MIVGLPFTNAVSNGVEAFAIAVRLLEGVWVRTPKKSDTERAIAANTINKFLTCVAVFASELFDVLSEVEFWELGLINE